MVKKLGPIVLLALMGGTALAQESSPATVRLFSGARPDPTIQRDVSWDGAQLQLPAPKPVPAATTASPIELLLSLAEAF